MNQNKPTHRKHNPYHDYSSRCIYHITLVVSDRCKVFGHMVDARGVYANLKKVYKSNGEPDYGQKTDGTPWTEWELAESAKVQFTPLGLDVQKAIQAIPKHEEKAGNDVQILGACVMPEHIHFVLFIKKPSKKTLGLMIRGFKQGCNKALRKYLRGDLGKVSTPNGDAFNKADSLNGDTLTDSENGDSEKVSPSGIAPFLMEAINARRNALHDASIGRRLLEEHALFEEDFDETRLRRKGQLQKMIVYVHNNPKHRWLRDNKPQWLLPIRGIVIAGRLYDAIGNVNLLALQRFQDHTRYKWYQANDTEAVRNHKNDCVVHARKNFAIVSPFVHPDEAAVRDYCLKEGHSIIQLCDNGFSDLQQCPGGLYDYCVNGQVLMLVPSGWSHIDRKGKCTRQECNVLNGYAQEIVEEINND